MCVYAQVHYLHEVRTVVGSYLDNLNHLTRLKHGIVPRTLEGLPELLSTILYNATLWESRLRQLWSTSRSRKHPHSATRHHHQHALAPLTMAEALLSPLTHSPLFGISGGGDNEGFDSDSSRESWLRTPLSVEAGDLCPALTIAKNIACAGVRKSIKPCTMTLSVPDKAPDVTGEKMTACTMSAYGCNVLPVLLKDKVCEQQPTGLARIW